MKKILIILFILSVLPYAYSQQDTTKFWGFQRQQHLIEKNRVNIDTLATDVAANADSIDSLRINKIGYDDLYLTVDTTIVEFPPGTFTYIYKYVYGKDTESAFIGRIDTVYNDRHYKGKNYFNDYTTFNSGADFNTAVDFRINAPGYNGGTGGNYYAGSASSVVINGNTDTITSTNSNGQIYINGNHNKVSGNAWGVWLNGQYLHAQYKGLWVPAGSDNSFQKKPIPFSDQAIFWNEPIGMVTSDALPQTTYPQRNSIFQQVLGGTDSTKFEWAIYQPSGTYNNYGLFAWQHFVPWESGGSGGITGQRYRNLFSIDNASGNLDIIFNKSQWQGVTGWSAYGDVIVDNGNFVVDNYIDAPRLDSLETYYAPQWSGTSTGLNASTARTSLSISNLTNKAQVELEDSTGGAAGNYITWKRLNDWTGSTAITTLGTVTTGTWNAGAVTSSGAMQGTSGRFTNLTDGFIPYHISDAAGLGNSGISWNNSTLQAEINSGAANIGLIMRSGDGLSGISLNDNATTDVSQVVVYAEGNDMVFYAGASERLRIKANGNILMSSAGSNVLLKPTSTSQLSLRNSADNSYAQLTVSNIFATAIAYFGSGITSNYNATNSFVRISGGNNTGTPEGATITAYGSTHATNANQIVLTASGNIVLTDVPVYADNAAATSGGLTAGMVYRTSTGQLMIVY
jgi:hypothetical protein